MPPFRALLCLLPGLLLGQAKPDGAQLYRQYCAACHGQEGRGIPNAFPPLAGSDFLAQNREKSLRAPLEGLREKIVVNGATYQGWMPPVTLDDAQLTAVFNYVLTSFGNSLPPVTTEEIAALRARTKYPTHAQLLAAMSPDVLPAAPAGWRFVVAAPLDFQPTRLAMHPDGQRVLVLAANGDVWTWEAASGTVALLFAGKDYLDPKLGDATCLGMGTDDQGRLYVISNQGNKAKLPVYNEVTIWRTAPWRAGWSRPQPWLRTGYNFGVGPYNHGVNHLAQGPDGLLYVSSGSRTDGGEEGNSPNYDKSGENGLTAKLWRLDPRSEHPQIQIFADGLRNTYHFTWDRQGRLLGVENGTDADTPEELNWIERGKHYGFPYEFGDWTTKPYPHTPDAPRGLAFVRPFKNVGPDAADRGGTATFTPHSSPSTILELGADWPAPLGGSFLISRFGNYLKDQSGFDLLQARLDFERKEATVTTVATPLARPISMVPLPGHRILIAEYCRGNSLAAGTSTPGRLIILEPTK
jgi:glucose/arabinose dehydrogenase/cytochrome c553